MRQRNIKNLDERIEANANYLIEDPRACRGHWREIFKNDHPIYLEIGCGKGKFITAHAEREPNCNFIACEGQASVVLRALEKAEEKSLDNLRVFIDYVHDLSDYFAQGEIAGIYLNFSDPWPKARHAKRRLTYHKRLQNYKQVLQTGGFIEFKTDNEALFEFTLEEIKQCGYPIVEMTRDLHRSAAAEPEPRHLLTETGGFGCTHPARHAEVGSYAEKSRTFLTEYEAKFSAQGKNINFVRI